jgi:hypothetical protein
MAVESCSVDDSRCHAASAAIMIGVFLFCARDYYLFIN